MIEKYIQELLKDNNRVILPDFGAFLVRATSKHKDSNDLALKLPDVYFSPFLKFNDELLVKFVIEKEKITKEEAMIKIKAFIISISYSFTYQPGGGPHTPVDESHIKSLFSSLAVSFIFRTEVILPCFSMG